VSTITTRNRRTERESICFQLLRTCNVLVKIGQTKERYTNILVGIMKAPLETYCCIFASLQWSTFFVVNIQISKNSTTNSSTMQINLKSEHLHYWLSQCNGVRRCGHDQCDHVLPRSMIKNNCKQYPTAELISTEECEVEFVYIFLINKFRRPKEVDWRVALSTEVYSTNAEFAQPSSWTKIESQTPY